MESLVRLSQRIASPLLRITLGVVVIWIGGLKFADPAPVLGLLEASFSFLAVPAVVYALGVVEVAAAVMLFAGIGVRYVALLLLGLFAGTLATFLIAPQVSYGDGGFPYLSLAGEFLLKDLVLFASAVVLLAGAETEAG